VTLLKSLNYNPVFVDRIEQLNAQESNHILAFLREHLLQADDLTVRWKWTPGAIAFWDNRSVVHRAIPGGYDVTLREGKRTAIFGERPFFDPEKSESLSERLQRLKVNKSIDENSKTNGASKVDRLAKVDEVAKHDAPSELVLNN
jgi:sulfonate dioxygenase